MTAKPRIRLLPATPLSQAVAETGGFASPPRSGFAYRHKKTSNTAIDTGVSSHTQLVAARRRPPEFWDVRHTTEIAYRVGRSAHFCLREPAPRARWTLAMARGVANLIRSITDRGRSNRVRHSVGHIQTGQRSST
jgi:hypothetical protein